MEWNLSASDLSKKITYSEFTQASLADYTHLMSPNELAKIAFLLGKEVLEKINDYRVEQGLETVASSEILQQATILRAKETIHDPNHTRENGENGMDAPYELGYAKDRITQGEMIEHLKSNSMKWIIQHASDTVLKSYLDSDASFIITSDIVDQSIGVYIEENEDHYLLSFVYLNAKQEEIQEEPLPEAPEMPLMETKEFATTPAATDQPENPSQRLAKMTPEEINPYAKGPAGDGAGETVTATAPTFSPKESGVNKSTLLYLYNEYLDMDKIDFASPLFSELMMTKAKAKQVFDKKDANQEEVTQVTNELKAIMDRIMTK